MVDLKKLGNFTKAGLRAGARASLVPVTAASFVAGAAYETAKTTAGAGIGILRAFAGSNPIKHATVKGVAVPIGLTRKSIGRMAGISALGATAYGASTVHRSQESFYEYPDEQDGVGPQFKNNLGAEGQLVLDSHYASRKY